MSNSRCQRPSIFVSALGASGTCAAAVVTAGIAAFGLNATSSDTVIASAFERAFASLAKPAPVQAEARYDMVAGSEDFWLRSAGQPDIVRAVSVGQQITLSSAGGDRRLIITDVHDAGEAATHIDTSPSAARVLVITCREGDPVAGREIRLRVEGGSITESAVAPVARAL